MTALLLIAALLGAADCVGAPEPPRTVFPPRPRLAYSRTEIGALRTDAARAGERQRIVRGAERLLQKELHVPQKEGNWCFYYACPKDASRLRARSLTEHVCPKCQKVYTDERTNAAYRTILSNRLEREMYSLALAYALTGEAKFAEPVRKAFLGLTRLYPTFERHDRWGRRGQLAVVGGRRYAQHLDEAASAISLAKTYDLIADSPVLSQKDRRTIEQGFLGATVREILKYQFFVDPKGVNNHITWFNAAYANVGVAIGDESLLHEAIHGGHGLLYQLAHSVTDDGLWYEGAMAYHFYALSAIQETLRATRRIGWDFSDNTRLKSLYLGPIEMAYPDGTLPVINDSDPARLRQWASFYKFAQDYFKDALFARYASRKATRDSEAVQPKSAALRGSGLVALRKGTGANAVCAMIDYGIHGGHHGHPDKLNLVLFALGRELILDPGRITYSVPEYETWARTTVAHNTVVVDGQNQKATEGQLLFFEDTDDYAATLCVSRGAYRGFVLRRLLVLTVDWLADVYAAEGKRTATMDWLAHVRGRVSPPVAVAGTALQGASVSSGALGDGNGYQHLRDLTRWGTGAPTVFRYQQSDGKTLAIHCLQFEPTATFAGNGIGYRLTDRVPFLLRRQSGKSACFVTVYDLSGTGDGVKSVVVLPQGSTKKNPPLTQCLRLRIGTEAATAELLMDLRDQPAGRSPVSMEVLALGEPDGSRKQ